MSVPQVICVAEMGDIDFLHKVTVFEIKATKNPYGTASRELWSPYVAGMIVPVPWLVNNGPGFKSFPLELVGVLMNSRGRHGGDRGFLLVDVPSTGWTFVGCLLA
jgi:hypothetical protein